MTIWGLNSCYMPQFPQIWGGGFNSLIPGCPTFPSLASSLFTFGSPRYDVSNCNVFGFTPPTNFSYMPQLDNPFAYMGQLSFTPRFAMPQFFSPNLTSYSSTSTGNMFGFLSVTRPRTSSPSSSSTSSHSFNTNTNLPTLTSVGYNATKAQNLAAAASKECINRFDGKCARHVKNSIQNAGLGAYQPGHGYQMDTVLGKNKNFKQISAEGIDLKKLPAGCVLVYERGVSGYSSEYGHVEITLGDGTAVSGGRTRNIRPGAKIFVPV